MREILFLDGSYICFYRYFAIIQWWGLANKDKDLNDACYKQEFITKFAETFIDKVKEIPKQLKLRNPYIILARDCSRSNIWRTKIYPLYKTTRKDCGTNIYLSDCFELAYKELFQKAGVNYVISHDNLEADDCIAILSQKLYTDYYIKNLQIYIITSDTDYLQLVRDRITIFNLKYKNLIESKGCFNNPDIDLFCKIVAGDKSDNIPGVFNRCGIKTAYKYYQNRELFNKKLDQDESAKQRFQFNNTLISFQSIPRDLTKQLLETHLKNIETMISSDIFNK